MAEKEKMQEVLPEGWEIKEVFSVAKVLISNVDKKSYYDNEMLVKLCNYLDVYKNERITSDLDFMIATATKKEIEKFNLNKDDVIITKDSETPDDIAVSSVVADELKNVLCGYHLALLRPQKTEVNGQYLTLALKTNLSKRYFGNHATGVTRFGLALSAIKQAKIFVPPLPEQTRIASIISTCDEAIDKTDIKIEKLKRIKQGLMQDLFRFGFDENGKMRSEATHRFKDSPLGRIPEEWEVKIFNDIATIKRGASPRPIDDPKYFSEMGRGWIRISDVTSVYKYLDHTEQYLSLLGENNSVKVNPGDLIMSICATIGKPAILKMYACIHDGFVHFSKLKQEIDTEWLFYLIDFSQYKIASLNQTGTQGNLNAGIVGLYAFAQPPKPEQSRIACVLSSADEAIEKEEAYKNKLLAIKRGLMEDLLSGKVRVNKLIKEAA